MRPTKREVLAVAFAVWSSGCATITRGEKQRVEIRSDPPGAKVFILPHGDEVETPARVKIRRDRAVTLLVHKDGYRPTRVYLDREHDPWASLPFAGNIILGGLIGMDVDFRSGALLHLVPNPVEIILEPESDDVEGPTASER